MRYNVKKSSDGKGAFSFSENFFAQTFERRRRISERKDGGWNYA